MRSSATDTVEHSLDIRIIAHQLVIADRLLEIPLSDVKGYPRLRLGIVYVQYIHNWQYTGNELVRPTTMNGNPCRQS